MTIYNANVKELQDAPGSEYFKYLRLKSQEGAINKAKVDVARVRMLGNVGEKERVCETRKQTSKIESETVVFEQEKAIHVARATAQVKVMDAQYETEVSVATIEATKRAKQKEVDLLQIVMAQQALVAKEKERAEFISKVTVDCETIEAMADAHFYQAKAEADSKTVIF